MTERTKDNLLFVGLLALLWACLGGEIFAATRTSTQSGNWSDTAVWGGAAAPVDGDIAIITSGHTVTVTANAAAGSNSGAVGKAVEIRATDATTFGKLIVNDGVTLTLKGNDATTNGAMEIDRYAVFEPAPGSTIVVDCASNFQTVIANSGIINAIGTSGKHITFTSPAANVSWNNSIAAEAIGAGFKFDATANIAASRFAQFWLANAAGTGPGAVGDTSVSFGGTHASSFGTERSSLAAVTASGDYYIDYDMGIVYFYWTYASGTPSFTKTYKYLTVAKGWGITNDANTTYNEAKFDYCDFKYLGNNTSTDARCLSIKNKQSAAVATNRLFSLKHSSFTNCHKPISLGTCDGTLADPLLIDANTFNACGGDGTVGGCITFYRATNTYLSIVNNTIKSRSTSPFFAAFTFGAVRDNTGVKIDNNTANIAGDFAYATSLGVRFPNGSVSNNVIDGVGASVDYRALAGMGGSSGNNLTISGNTFRRVMRGIHYSSFSTISKNVFDRVYHHGVVSGIDDSLQIEDIGIENNLFMGEAGAGSLGYDASTHIELGYNHAQWLDNLRVVNNTFVGNPSGIIGFGDIQDVNAYTLATRIVVANNLGRMNTAGTSKAYQRRADGASNIFRGHILNFDHNLDYNYTTRYTSLNRQGTFSKGGTPYNTQTISTRNLPGVALFDPNFSTATGKTLDLTVTSATDQTLSYDGGTAVQLVVVSGTATSGANTSTSGLTGLYGGTLTDTAATFNTTKNNAACPMNHWVKITGGTGSGQIRACTFNTATVLTTAPGWTTVPDNTSTYAVIRSEAQLTDGADTVQAGIFLSEFPTATAQDTGISFADSSVTGSNPLLANSAGTAVVDYKITTGSPALNVGDATYAPATDYYGTARPMGAADDLGFFELPITSSGKFFLLLGSLERPKWQPVDIHWQASDIFGALAP